MDNEQELIRKLINLQITQTDILNQLLAWSTNELDTDAEPDTKVTAKEEERDQAQVHTANLPLKVGDHVTILNLGKFRTGKETVCKVIKIGLRVTVLRPDGTKIVRLARNLRKVQ